MCAQRRLRSVCAFAQSDQSSLSAWRKLPIEAQRRLWSDWADAQADLSLHWAHMPFCWFCHKAAQFLRFRPVPWVFKWAFECIGSPGLQTLSSTWSYTYKFILFFSSFLEGGCKMPLSMHYSVFLSKFWLKKIHRKLTDILFLAIVSEIL